jgi:hypothetical protein
MVLHVNGIVKTGRSARPMDNGAYLREFGTVFERHMKNIKRY